MTDANKDILITPNVSQTAEPKIEFTGFDNNTLSLNVLDNGTLSFEGTSGQLFSISDSLSGTIFAVNDVSGIPSIEVDDDGSIRLAEYDGNILIGTAVDNGNDKLQLDGSAYITSGTDTGLTVHHDTFAKGLVLHRNDGSNAPSILFKNNNTQCGVMYGGADTKLYWKKGTSSTSNQIFHDAYHPNADKWTTARSHTVTLTGEVTGTTTQSVDGSGNKTWSIATTLNNNSLDDQYVTVGSRYSGNGSALSSPNKASVRLWDVSTSNDKPSGTSDGLVYTAGWDSTSWAVQQFHDFHSNDFYLRSKQNGTWMSTWDRVFHDTYHPNADKWTTSRTLSLTGDVTGSVSWDGSGNASLAATVANDSHTHSIYVPKSGGTMTGILNGTTASFTGKVNFQGDAAIEGGSGYGVFKGYTGNDNHFIAVRGKVANSSTLSITGGHQTTFVEHANAADEGWYFKSKTTGSYRELARIDGLGDMYLDGNIKSIGTISSNNIQVMNCAHWSNSSTSTGAVKITLPGTAGSVHSMPIIKIYTYQYSSSAHVVYTISGHNWSTSSNWYNNRVTSEGGPPLAVRLGHDGTNYCIIIGETNTSWSYGSVTVELKAHPSYYASSQNMTTGWGTSQITSMPSNVTSQSVRRIFANDYHPYADKWTTGRNHTVTLTGEVTGSASQTVDGSGNKTWSIATTVGNSALNDQYVKKTGDTMSGELQINARLDVGDGTGNDHEIRIYKKDNNVSDHIQFYNGTTRMGEIGCHDTTWLRINQETSKNIFTPRMIRADGGFQVDGKTVVSADGNNLYENSVALSSKYAPIHSHPYDNYGSWTAKDHDGSTYTITSGDTLHYKEGWGVDVNFTADDQLTITAKQGDLDGRYYTEDEINRSLARLAGWVPAYSNSNEATVVWDKANECVALSDEGDTSVGMAFKAFRMKSGDKVDIQLMLKGSVADTDGTYLRLYFYTGDLPDGKTHVSNSAGYTLVQEDTTGDSGWYENNSISTSWQNKERTYTASADGYCSIVILNWTGYTGTTYVKQPNITFTKVNDANKLDGKDSTEFALAHSHPYVPLAGGEMTGALTIDTDNATMGALRIEANQTDPDGGMQWAQMISSTLSGSDTVYGDRLQGGIWIDVNSTQTGGGTTHEHRAYGVYVDLDSTGTSSIVTGGYFRVAATPASGVVSEVSGVVGYAEDDGGSGSVTNVFGVKGNAFSDNSTSDTNLLCGGLFKAFNAHDSGVISAARGVLAQVNITSGTGDIYGNTMVVDAHYYNESNIMQTHTSYLFYGNYQGQMPSDPYGVYIQDAVPNHFGGSIRTGDGSTSPASTAWASYGFKDETNTGMYRPFDNQVGFMVDGESKMSIMEYKVTFQNVSAGVDIDGVLQANNSIKVAGVAPANNAPSSEAVELSGYGLIGNRNNIYFTNSNSNGWTIFGIGGAHNANPKLTVTSSGITVTGSADVNGNVDVSGDLLYSGSGSWDIKNNVDSQNITFYTTPSGGSATERFTIKPDEVKIYRREMTNSDGNAWKYGSILISDEGSVGMGAVVVDTSGTGCEYSSYYAKLRSHHGYFSGTLYYGTLSQISDDRLKSDIQPITSALDTITQIQGITYTRDGKPMAGVTAQQLETVLPDLVHTNDPDGDCHKCPKDAEGNEIHDYKTVEYTPLISYLIEAVKEQQKQIDELKEKLEELK